MASIELAIIWDRSRHDDVRAFVENWFSNLFAHADDSPTSGCAAPADELPLRQLTESLVYQLILDDTCAEQPENCVTYAQVIAALKQECQIARSFSADIDQMAELAIGVFQDQRKTFERFRKAARPEQSNPRQRTEWSLSVSA